MAAPELHIVGGFLGSGKTTAIAAAARRFLAQGRKVGVVTNDQGRYLVDTLFFRDAQVPTVEVTGGCFCCNYDDFEERLAALDAAARPDAIFAESVGSCADVVATVVQPLLILESSGFKPTSFSVFGDSRLLVQHFLGGRLPFSEDVVYIFDKQLEEAGLIVVNKADLVDQATLAALLGALRERYPKKPVTWQNTLSEHGVDRWIRLIRSERLALPEPLAEMDYETYGAGEARLAWLDREVSLKIRGVDGRDAVRAIVSGIESAIRERNWPIGHLKFVYDDGRERGKISFTTVAGPPRKVSLPRLTGDSVRLLVNARVAAPIEDLERQVDSIIAGIAERKGIALDHGAVSSFHPAFPRPTHRLAD